jgi:K+-transporting ATPase ATPase A chain
MTIGGLVEIAAVLTAVMALAYPIGEFMAKVFQGQHTFLTPVVGPIERAFYRLSLVDPNSEQTWLEYTVAMLIFAAGCFLALYAQLRLQAQLPLNPQGFEPVAPDLAFNTAISFITNANWQAYSGEQTMSHLSQMVGLTTHNFLDTAAAMALAVAVTRALARSGMPTIGNFWVDLTRATLYVLLPLSVLIALAFVALGVPQTLLPWVEATTIEGVRQIISLGPVASQEAIKLLGNNGGGFFNANSAHPFENPSQWSNMLQNWSQLVLPVALVFTFGRMVADPRQGRSLLATMGVLFISGLFVLYWAEAHGNPLLTALGVDPSLGNLEGKDLRFDQASTALFAQATTGTGTGAANASLDSLTPIASLVPLFNLLMGCISPGGVGTGLYSILLIAIVAVFVAGLMVGRTPEYLGKKIEAREMRYAVLALLVSPIFLLGFAGVSANIKIGLDSLGNAGPRGLTEILYAYASTVSHNGSTFAGLSANTVWYNTTTGVTLFFGRFAHIVPIMAMAGSLASKTKKAPSAGTFPTHGPLFVSLLLGTIAIGTLLQYLPALTLGPILEQFLLAASKSF